jgi:hypothetical protein
VVDQVADELRQIDEDEGGGEERERVVVVGTREGAGNEPVGPGAQEVGEQPLGDQL